MAITNSDLALRIAELVDRWNTRENQLRLMLTQPTGMVTVTDGLEQNHLLPSFPQLQLDVTRLVSEASGGVAEAYAHANTALQHRNAAGEAADAASASAAEARATADQAADDAAAVLAAATAAKDAAAASSTAAATSSDAAAGSANAAANSASTANTHRLAAADSADAAADSQATAGAHADTAGTEAGIASAAKAAAEAARDKARQWSSAPTGTPVEPGEYSAKHWASQAAAAVTGTLVYMGGWDASSGAYPTPAQKGYFYKVTTGGTHGGYEFNVGDQIVHNGSSWDVIDNTERVASVNGKSGSVVLVAADIGDLGALATRNTVSWQTDVTNRPATMPPDAHNHPITQVTGLAAALDAKAPIASPVFNGYMTITGGRAVLNAPVGQNSLVQLADETGANKAGVVWNRGDNSVRLRRYNAAGDDAAEELSVLPGGIRVNTNLTNQQSNTSYTAVACQNIGGVEIQIAANANNEGRVAVATDHDMVLYTNNQERLRVGRDGHVRISKSNGPIDSNSYGTGHLELRTNDASFPMLSFHRSGIDATTIYWNGGRLRTRDSGNVDRVIAEEGRDVAFRDVYANRDGTTGVIFFGSGSNNRYLYYNGTHYELAFAGLKIAGGPVLTAESGVFRIEGQARAYNRWQTLAANGAAWVDQPRTFVSSGDPGGQAQDGDIWIQF
ncbi:hypothetical protein [Lysobacter sp. Hz 25]|uniref:hypothetical protein n=1 Tax=Lysobacter sp. Hz 25 TaxID=3383698 RepID=UPI0038D40625